MRIIALIPARGGSKRIPRKNLAPLGGKPLIAWTIEAALASKELVRVILSTDDEGIAEVAEEYGAEVPFLRPAAYAEDGSSDRAVFQHALGELEKEGEAVDAFVHLRPTTPFKTSEMIDDAVRIWKEEKPHSVRSMHRLEGKGHPYWVFRKGENGRVEPFIDGVDLEKDAFQRQALPEAWTLNGVVDLIDAAKIRERKSMWGTDIRILEIEERDALDIDTPEDLKFAEFLMNERQKHADR